MPTSDRSVSRPCSVRVSQALEPPRYGPVCPVVGEGRCREAPPYPDQAPPARPAAIEERDPLATALTLSRSIRGLADRSSELLPLAQAHKLAFLNGKADRETINPHALTKTPSPFMLLAGSIISASLITGVNSDLPGMTIAQVTENAYDTVTGDHLLIPQGTRLIGKYDSVVALQGRASAS
jgi:type IV secretion system protein TrbI